MGGMRVRVLSFQLLLGTAPEKLALAACVAAVFFYCSCHYYAVMRVRRYCPYSM